MGRFRVTANQFRCPCIAAFALVVAAVFAPCRTLGQSAQAQVVEAAAEPTAATLQGIVRDSENHPVAGATVHLQAAGAQSLSARSDTAGAYRFSALPPGVYVLHVEMAGYGDATVNSFFIGQKESKTIDLTLKSVKASGPAATVAPPRFSTNLISLSPASPILRISVAMVPTRLSGTAKSWPRPLLR